MGKFARRKHWSVALALLLSAALPAVAQTAKGTVTDVTVFRDQALVTRAVDVTGAAGPLEIVVTELPENLVPTTLSAEAPGGCQVRSVTYRTRAVSGDSRPEVKAIDETIAGLRKQLRELEARQESIENKKQVISALGAFTASTTQLELQQGVLDFSQMSQLAEYALEKQDSFVQEKLDIEAQKEEKAKQLELEERRRGEVAAGFSRAQREALVHLTKDSDQPVTITLRYLVGQVTWRPQYNLRSTQGQGVVTVEYNAVVNQMSGEDWTHVHLLLSTAQPTFSAEAPGLAPLDVTLGPKEPMAKEEVQEALAQVSKQRIEVQQAVQPPAQELSSTLNVLAGQEQVLELGQAKEYVATRPSRSEGVSATYELPHPATLASRTDEQILQIASAEMPAEFRHIAVPVLTSFVYVEAAAKNESPYVLLAGPYNAYLDGQFVGRGNIQLVASGEEFKAGFGADPQVQVTRELASKSETIEGGNLASEFEYSFDIANYGQQPVQLTLEDRMPYSKDGSVQVKMIEAKPEISQDPEYQRTELAMGLLRWDIEIPARAIKDTAAVVSYRFRMAHDKQMAIRGLFQ